MLSTCNISCPDTAQIAKREDDHDSEKGKCEDDHNSKQREKEQVFTQPEVV
jgi:hypothetical protein